MGPAPKEAQVQNVTNEIIDFPAWICMWNTYMSIAAAFRPHLLTKMIGCYKIIIRFATTYPTRFWLAYVNPLTPKLNLDIPQRRIFTPPALIFSKWGPWVHPPQWIASKGRMHAIPSPNQQLSSWKILIPSPCG